MAGKTVGDTIQFNSMQAGQLALHESKNPSSPRYAHGLESADGVVALAGRLTHAPLPEDTSSAHLYPADYCPYPDSSYYLRNTASGDAASLTGDISGLTTANNLSDTLNNMMIAGNYLAYTSTSGFPGGKYNSFNGALNNSACRVGTATTSFLTSGKVKFVRAVAFTVGGIQRWAIVGDIGVKTKQQWFEYIIFYKENNLDETPSSPVTICNGKGSYTESGKSAWYEPTVGTFTVIPETETIPLPAVTLVSDLYLVGKMSMFDLIKNKGDTSFTDARSRSFTVTAHSGTVATYTHDKSLNGEKPDDNDIYILAWGTGGASPVWSIGSSDDSAVQALKFTSTDIFTVSTGFTGGSTFAFMTPRNKIVGKRRVGIAQVGTGASGAGPRSGCIGFSKVFDNAGSGNHRVIGTLSTDPYVVTLDSKAPLWVEVSYQGVYCGTDDAEYLISGEQDLKAYNLRKISSVGGSASINQDLFDASTQLDGVIYFLTKTGFATFQFSNEAQGYIPKRINLIDYGFSTPTSIASFRDGRCILMFAPSMDVPGTYASYPSNTIIIYTPESGSITSLNFPQLVVSSSTYYPIGVRTDKDNTHVIYSNGTIKKMVHISNTKISGSNIRTTRFMVGPERIPKINKIYLMMSNSFGGRVRVEGQTEWEQIPYSSTEIALGSFTGTKEIRVADTVSDHSIGKYIEINFTADEKMNLVGVAVGGDS
jgi:hypothetical protein